VANPAERKCRKIGLKKLGTKKGEMSIVMLPGRIILANMENESLKDCFTQSCITWKQKKAITFFRDTSALQ
jgi:hypothetical protein